LFPVDSIQNLPGFAWTLEYNPFNNYTEHKDCSPVDPYVYPLGFYGVLGNGKFYAGTSATRTGPHPYLKYVVYPSYSTAKSNFGTLLVGALDKLENVLDVKVTDWISEADATWENTTVRHLLDQSTNHYGSLAYGLDEGNLETNINFFYSYSTSHKLNYSLNAYDFHPETELGTVFNYHSTNLFLLSAVAERLVQSKYGMSVVEFYQQHICVPLKLSSLYCNPKRSLGEERIPFGGYGMFYVQDDLAKIANFWTYSENGSGIVSERVFKTAMQMSDERGVLTGRRSDPKSTCYPSSARLTPIPYQRYSHGFWSEDTMGDPVWTSGVITNCTNPKLVFESGYGGIRLMVAKNAWAYLQYDDNYDFKVGRAVATLANLLGCPSGLKSQ
jgi:CubicO group peptidase (beta-lactamase class C family)